jgi:hypothetical protein
MATAAEYRTADFRPAPDGWRIVYLLTDGTIEYEPMPGWLIREEVEYDSNTFEDIAVTGHRTVVAAQLVDCTLIPADDHSSFWHVLGPGQPDPTPEEAAAEQARRRKPATEETP